MDWERLAEVEEAELECSEALLDSAYEFLAANELSEQAARAQPARLLKLLSTVQQVMKVETYKNCMKLFSVCLSVAR